MASLEVEGTLLSVELSFVFQFGTYPLIIGLVPSVVLLSTSLLGKLRYLNRQSFHFWPGSSLRLTKAETLIISTLLKPLGNCPFLLLSTFLLLFLLT